jgi:hypothetical protein
MNRANKHECVATVRKPRKGETKAKSASQLEDATQRNSFLQIRVKLHPTALNSIVEKLALPRSAPRSPASLKRNLPAALRKPPTSFRSYSPVRGPNFPVRSTRLGGILTFPRVNIFAIAQGSSEMNISFVVEDKAMKDALPATHREFGLGGAARINRRESIAGTGGEGSTPRCAGRGAAGKSKRFIGRNGVRLAFVNGNDGDELATVASAGFEKNVGDVKLDRALGNAKLAGDGARRKLPQGQMGDLYFASGE